MFLTDRLNFTSQRQYTDEGFLRVPSRIGRTGIQDYLAVEMGVTDREPNAVIKVFRPAEEVFAEDSLNSFGGKPVTNNHPPELLNASNSKQFSVGMSDKEIDKDGDFVTAVLNITDAETIAAIESGKVELSNGYTADIDWSPGVTPDGQQYDAIQRNIKGNHIAVVTRGRAGSECRVADHSLQFGDETKMKIMIDGVEFEVTDQVAQAVGKLTAENKRLADQMSESEEEKKKMKEDAEEEKMKAKKTEDSIKAQLDAASAKVPDATTLDKMVTDRMSLVDACCKIYPEVAWEGKDSATLMKEVVAAKCPNVQMDSVSGDYVQARFDILVEDAKLNPQKPLDDTFKGAFKDSDKQEDNRPAHVIAREKMMNDSRDAWKKK